MRSFRFTATLPCEQWDIASLIAEVATAKRDVASRSAAALAQICHGVLTGEGPTAAGRVHFSRTIDAEDTALCARILILAGQKGEPVSRAEADVLFDIDAVAGERRDGGCFDDLFAKALMHHVMSACGFNVPRREIALAFATPLDAWTSTIDIDPRVRPWLEMRVRELDPGSHAGRAIGKAVSGTELPKAKKLPIKARFDLAA